MKRPASDPSTPSVRMSKQGDAVGIHEIYAPLVRETVISFELSPPTVEELECRIQETSNTHPWLIYEDNEGDVTGYAYASRFRERLAYQWSVEVSAYVHTDHRRKGIARLLYRRLFEVLRIQGFFNAFAGIALPNPASVRLHEELGFAPIGRFTAVGYKLEGWHDVGWWELQLAARNSNPEPPRSFAEVVTSGEVERILGQTDLNAV